MTTARKFFKFYQREIDVIVKYTAGTASFAGAPFINHQSLSEKGFIAEEIKRLEDGLATAFELGFVFNKFILGDECLLRLGFLPEEYNDKDWKMLEALGYSDDEIEEANAYVCGTMMLEGAPHLKKEDLPVFDCANKCGQNGQRFIHAHGHIRMMGATQPFISGAISKTINLPHEASLEDIADSYKLSWELGLKACAMYRDGSKESQPLSNKSDSKSNRPTADKTGAESGKTEQPSGSNGEYNNKPHVIDLGTLTDDEILVEINHRVQNCRDTKLKRQLARIVERRALPAKRRGFVQKAKINGQAIFLRTGEYSDGTLGEIFIDMAKEGATMRSMLNCFAISISIGLQYGVPLEEFVDKFAFTRFEPSGFVEHPNIKSTTSIVDLIFRVLGYEYLQRADLVHVPDKPEEENNGSDDWDEIPTSLEYAKNSELSVTRVIDRPMGGIMPQPIKSHLTITATQTIKKEQGIDAINAAARNMQSDAPPCNVCGNIMVRSGACYKCNNCGNQGGCG